MARRFFLVGGDMGQASGKKYYSLYTVGAGRSSCSRALCAPAHSPSDIHPD